MKNDRTVEVWNREKTQLLALVTCTSFEDLEATLRTIAPRYELRMLVSGEWWGFWGFNP